mgnify:FL=1
MKKELPYFYVEKNFGFNQDEFPNLIMRGGGCACVTACASAIYFKKYFGLNSLCALDVNNISFDDYVLFSQKMRPFLYPHFSGIDKLDIYIDGFNGYLKSVGENSLSLSGFDGKENYEKAKAVLKNQIDKNYPVPFLLLKHKNPLLKDYVWHWFILGGYEEFENSLMVKIISYGEWMWFDFDDLWNNAFGRRGGMILFERGDKNV